MTPKSERGAMLIMVAICLFALTLFSAIVLDYGVLWASRAQAQTAADAGALSAALSLLTNPTETALARDAARKLANANRVWGEAPLTPDILVDLPIACPPGSGTADPDCVRVDVQRGQVDRNGGVHTNVLPTFFANLAGITSQRIMATAMAQVTSGNAVQCIKPFAVPDKWIDNNEAPIGGWTQADTFQPPTDQYVAGEDGSGFTVEADYGYELMMKPGSTNDWSAGWAQLLTFTGNNSASEVQQEVVGCPDFVPTVGIYDGTTECNSDDDADPSRGCVAVKNGAAVGPTIQNGIDELVALDQYAHWNGSAVTGGCMDTPGSCVAINPARIDLSPRIVPVALFNPQSYYDAGCAGSNCAVQVTNLIGFFIEGTCFDVYGSGFPAWCGSNTAEAKKAILGRIINYPGQFLNTAGPSTSSFTQFVRLVR